MTSSTLEQPQQELGQRLINAINFNDHINYTDPLGWETLRDRWVNKTIGKDWREGQMSDIWDLLPDEWKPGVKKAATEFGQNFAKGWQDRRTIEGKEFLNPLAYTDFAVTRSLETIGIPFEWMAQGISKASGLDIELARIATDFVPVAGIAGAVGKKINQTRLLNRINRIGDLNEKMKYIEDLAAQGKHAEALDQAGKWGMGVMFHTGFENLSPIDKVKVFLADSEKATRRLYRGIRRKIKGSDNPNQLGFDFDPVDLDPIETRNWEQFQSYTESAQKAQVKIQNRQFTTELVQETLADRAIFKDGKVVGYRPETNWATATKEGYQILGEVREEWNKWWQGGGNVAELVTRPLKAKVEHMVAKGAHMNWFWTLDDGPNGIRSWRPGTRHNPNNVRILKDTTYDGLKNIAEQILYDLDDQGIPKSRSRALSNPDLSKRYVIDIEDVADQGTSIVYRDKPGDILIRRTDGTIVGRLGEYHSVLYAPDDLLIEVLSKKIKPNTGKVRYKGRSKKEIIDGKEYRVRKVESKDPDKFWVDPNASRATQIRQIREWRTQILREKIDLILDEADKGATSSTRISQAVLDDLANFNAEYGSLSPVLEELIKKEKEFSGFYLPTKTEEMFTTPKSFLPGGG